MCVWSSAAFLGAWEGFGKAGRSWMGRRAVQQFLAALVRGGKKSLEGCAGEVFGKGKELPVGKKSNFPLLS